MKLKFLCDSDFRNAIVDGLLRQRDEAETVLAIYKHFASTRRFSSVFSSIGALCL